MAKEIISNPNPSPFSIWVPDGCVFAASELTYSGLILVYLIPPLSSMAVDLISSCGFSLVATVAILCLFLPKAITILNNTNIQSRLRLLRIKKVSTVISK